MSEIFTVTVMLLFWMSQWFCKSQISSNHHRNHKANTLNILSTVQTHWTLPQYLNFIFGIWKLYTRSFFRQRIWSLLTLQQKCIGWRDCEDVKCWRQSCDDHMDSACASLSTFLGPGNMWDTQYLGYDQPLMIHNVHLHLLNCLIKSYLNILLLLA